MAGAKGYCPAFGNYPAEYNRAVHGPYYPWVNYGPRDTPFKEVKLGELKNWIMRRNKTPQAAIAAISRVNHEWHYKWLGTRYGSPVKGVFHLMFFMSFTSMILCYPYLKNHHRSHKYHW